MIPLPRESYIRYKEPAQKNAGLEQLRLDVRVDVRGLGGGSRAPGLTRQRAPTEWPRATLARPSFVTSSTKSLILECRVV